MPVLATFGGTSLRNFGLSSSSGSPSIPAIGDFESIATTTLGSSQATITFSNIAQTYTHLQIRFHAQNDTANTNTGLLLTFNGDSGANYSWHRVWGDGSSAFSSAGTSTSGIRIERMSAYTTANSIFGIGICDILDYRDTNKFKTIKNIGGVDANGSGHVALNSGNWRSTSAITSVSLTGIDGGNFKQYTSIALYGVAA
jgi:hypothetical protein